MALKNANDGSVLEMISYLDEVIVGNPLKPDNHRKVWAIYITCKDLPQWMLQLEDCWMVANIRTGRHLRLMASEIFASASTLRMKLHCRAYGARKLQPGWYLAFVA